RAEAAKETVAAVKALLPMDVALYLLNQKRQEIARLEEECNLTLYLAGNPSARQNEYSIEFIKRDIVPDLIPVPERVLVKEIEEPVRPGTSVAASRGTWDGQEEDPVSPPSAPVVVTGNGEAPEGAAPTQWRQGPSGPTSGPTDDPISTPTQSRQQDVLLSADSAPVWAVAR